jgi:hypothetical protein
MEPSPHPWLNPVWLYKKVRENREQTHVHSLLPCDILYHLRTPQARSQWQMQLLNHRIYSVIRNKKWTRTGTQGTSRPAANRQSYVELINCRGVRNYQTCSRTSRYPARAKPSPPTHPPLCLTIALQKNQKPHHVFLSLPSAATSPFVQT